MGSLVIKRGIKEIEFYKINSEELITIDITTDNGHFNDYVHIDLTKEEVLAVIKFLQSQIE